MPLATESTTVGDAVETVRGYLDAIDEEADGDLDAEGEYARALADQRGTLKYYLTGLVWVRDEAPYFDDDETTGWGADTDIVLAAPTAAEEAMMDRHRPRDASRDERRIWFVAAGTEAAPYHRDKLQATFGALGQLHPGYVRWAEAKLNSLATPGNLRGGSPDRPSDETPTSPASSTPAESEPSPTSTSESTATTSSSSDSPTD